MIRGVLDTLFPPDNSTGLTMFAVGIAMVDLPWVGFGTAGWLVAVAGLVGCIRALFQNRPRNMDVGPRKE